MADLESAAARVRRAAARWYEGKRDERGDVNTNVMCVGVAVAELLKGCFPLTEDEVKSEKGSQVKGLGRSVVSRALASRGETREFTSEGGRTSRGSLPLALDLAEAVNGLFSDGITDEERMSAADEMQGYFVERIQRDYFDKQLLKLEIDASKPVSGIVGDILDAARGRSGQQAGTVAQHLVGAKLELRFPGLNVGRDKANAADLQTNRQGDFRLGDTVFHVTTSPMKGLATRVHANIRDGLRPVVLVPCEKVQFAVGLFDSEGIGDRVGVQSIESFVGTNVEEMGAFDSSDIREKVIRLVRCYNDRIRCCEADKSLAIEEPDWMRHVASESSPSGFDYSSMTVSGLQQD